MRHKDFEDFLQDKFIKKNPMVLDDDIPDAFEDWLSEMDIQDCISYANEYRKES